MKLAFVRPLLAAALAGAALIVPAAPAAAIPVFDAANYAQNITQAARALEQINHQLQSLRNEQAMLENMARNLKRIDFPQLNQLTSAMQKVDRLIGEAKGIDFNVQGLDQKLRAMFPDAVDGALRSDARVAQARGRLDAALASLRQGMTLQAQVAGNVAEDGALLQQLAGRSQDAEGALAAQQATNQLLALGTKQQLQLQSLLAAGLRTQSLAQARDLEAEAEAREATRRFLGSGRAYTPQ